MIIKSRIKYLKFYHKFCKKITDQKINILFSIVGLSHEIRNLNQKKMKKLYSKNLKNIWGIDIKPEFPTNPTITLRNDFKKNTLQMANLLI